MKKADSNVGAAEFTEYWPTIRQMVGEDRRFRHANGSIKKGEFLQACGLDAQRWSEFERYYAERTGKGKITRTYFFDLLRGLGVTPQDIERKSKRKFSEEQLRELKRESWIKSNLDLIDTLMEDPDTAKMCRKLCQLQPKRNHRK